jgi:hypothetical protein
MVEMENLEKNFFFKKTLDIPLSFEPDVSILASILPSE